MDLAVLGTDVDPNDARRLFLEYRNAVRQNWTEADEALMRGYRELSRGRRLISMKQTMRQGGFDEQGLPRLAVARADRDRAYTEPITSDGSGVVWTVPDGSSTTWDNQYRTRYRVRFRAGTFEVPESLPWTRWGVHSAIVPSIPPRLRPAGKLDRFHILWEADWRLDPPQDPALLRRLMGDLWVVLAVWDLTSLERAVLAL